MYIYIPAYTFIGLSLDWQRSEIEKRREYDLLFGRRKGDKNISYIPRDALPIMM